MRGEAVRGTQFPRAPASVHSKDLASAKEIVQEYDVLELGDVYKVIDYYLHHRSEVEDYLRQQGTAADELRTRLEFQSEIAGIMERLLARLPPAEVGD